MPTAPNNAAKVVKLQNVCVHALGDKPAPFRMPEDMKVKEITFTHKSGGVTCAKMYSGMTKYGCGENYLGLVITKMDNTKVMMPLKSQQIPGFQRTMHHHAHWYTIQGVSNKDPKLQWKFGRKQIMAEGGYQIWYNEDLTNGTVADNAGVACYDVEIVGTPYISPKFAKLHRVMAELRRTKASYRQLKVVRDQLTRVWTTTKTMASRTELRRVRVECQRTKASVQQLKVVRDQLKRVSASSNTKASKRELYAVRTALRKSKASVRQLKATRAQLKQVWASSKTKASRAELRKATAELRKGKASVRQLNAVRGSLKRVHAYSVTKASKVQFQRVSIELRKSKASIRQLNVVRSQLKTVSASSNTKASKVELHRVRSDLRK